MAIACDTGSFTTKTSTGTQSYNHSLGATPDLILFWVSKCTALDTVTAGFTIFVGYATGTSSFGGVGISALDNDATGSCWAIGRNSGCVYVYDHSTNADVIRADLDSWSTTTFTLDWLEVTGDAYYVIWQAWSGFDEVGVWTDSVPGSAGIRNKAHGMTNAPDAIIGLHQADATTNFGDDEEQADGLLSLSFWNSEDNEQFTVGTIRQDPIVTSTNSNAMMTAYGWSSPHFNNSSHSSHILSADSTNVRFWDYDEHFSAHGSIFIGVSLPSTACAFTSNQTVTTNTTNPIYAKTFRFKQEWYKFFNDYGDTGDLETEESSDWTQVTTNGWRKNLAGSIYFASPDSTGNDQNKVSKVAQGTYGADQYAEAFGWNYTASSDHWTGIAVRINGDGDFYALWGNETSTPKTWKLIKYIDGSGETQLATGTWSYGGSSADVDSDRAATHFKLVAIGPMIYAYWNNKLLAKVRDTAITSGTPGLAAYSGATGSVNNGFTWFGCGNAYNAHARGFVALSHGDDAWQMLEDDKATISYGIGSVGKQYSIWNGGLCNTSPSNTSENSIVSDTYCLLNYTPSATPSAEWTLTPRAVSGPNFNIFTHNLDGHTTADRIAYFGFGDTPKETVIKSKAFSISDSGSPDYEGEVTFDLDGLSPKAFILFFSNATSEDSLTAHKAMNFTGGCFTSDDEYDGFTIAITDQDNVATTNPESKTASSSNDLQGVETDFLNPSTGAITMGTNVRCEENRLKFLHNSAYSPHPAWKGVVVVFAGNSVQADSQTVGLGNAVDNVVGCTNGEFEPQFVIGGYCPGNTVSDECTIGVAHYDGVSTVTQGCMQLSGLDAQTTPAIVGVASNTHIGIDILGVGTIDWKLLAQGFDATGFDVKTENAGGNNVNWSYLALRLGDTSSKVWFPTAETSTGNASDTTPNFPPATVGFLCTSHDTWNTSETDGTGGAWGFGLISSDDEASVCTTQEDFSSTNNSNTASITASKGVTGYDHQQTLLYQASLVSVDATGVTLNWTTADATAWKLIAFAFEDLDWTSGQAVGTYIQYVSVISG